MNGYPAGGVCEEDLVFTDSAYQLFFLLLFKDLQNLFKSVEPCDVGLHVLRKQALVKVCDEADVGWFGRRSLDVSGVSYFENSSANLESSVEGECIG